MKMNPSTTVALFVRLFAIGLMVYLLRVFVGEYVAYLNLDEYTISFPIVIALVAFLFFVAFLWKFPLFVATKLVSFENNASSTERLSEHSLYKVGIVLLGIYLLFWAISDTAYWWSFIHLQREVLPQDFNLGVNQKALVISTVVELIFSLVLIIGADKFATLIKMVRRAGL
jgi:hypothetical protein